MKKFAVLALAAAMFGLTACDEYTLPNPPAQENPAEPVFQASGLTVDATTQALDLPAVKDANEVPVLAQVSLTDFPTGSNLKLILQMSAEESFENYGDVATAISEEGQVSVSYYDFQTTYNATVSRGLDTKEIYIRYAAYAINGSETMRIGGPDVFYGATTLNVTPVLISHVIDETYFVVGNFCNWNVAAALPMTKLNPGNQYDEPDFYLNVTLDEAQAQAGYEFMIVPGSAVAAGNYEGAYGFVPSDDNANKGNLIAANGANQNAGIIDVPGSYQIKVNMYTLKCEIALAYEYLYGVGPGNLLYPMTTNNFVNYGGVMMANTNFYLACQNNSRQGLFYGMDEDTEATEDNGVYSYTMGKPAAEVGKLTRFPVAKSRELYYVKVDLNKLTASAATISTISIVGAFNGWNVEDAAAVMTPVSSRKERFTITDVNLPEGEFKFCVNHAWTLSFGGAMDNIVENGGNLNCAEAGVYDITLNFNTLPYSVTMVKK